MAKIKKQTNKQTFAGCLQGSHLKKYYNYVSHFSKC